jgi:hypothetical protein
MIVTWNDISAESHDAHLGSQVTNQQEQIGAPGGIRTPDPRSRNPLLYPLSYGRDGRSLRKIQARIHEKFKNIRWLNDLR